MPAHTPVHTASLLKTLGLLALSAVIVGCAQPQQSAALYDTTRENTQRDAESYAMGGGPRAASQIQLGFGSTGPATVAEQAPTADQAEGAAPESATLPRPLAEARSFLGTVPCPDGLSCDAARFMVTLAPSGEWRSRTTMLAGNEARQTLTEQGCWHVIGNEPLRIALMHIQQDTAKADLVFVNNNMLRVLTLNGVQPMLEHSLTRQPDLDPIDELKDRPALGCQ